MLPDRFAFPGFPSGTSETAFPHSQWRDRTGFSPDFPVTPPTGHLRPPSMREAELALQVWPVNICIEREKWIFGFVSQFLMLLLDKFALARGGTMIGLVGHCASRIAERGWKDGAQKL
jgi:hypothetical protein